MNSRPTCHLLKGTNEEMLQEYERMEAYLEDRGTQVFVDQHFLMHCHKRVGIYTVSGTTAHMDYASSVKDGARVNVRIHERRKENRIRVLADILSQLGNENPAKKEVVVENAHSQT